MENSDKIEQIRKHLEKGEKLSAEILKEIEDNTVNKYNLPKSYFIGFIDAEQQKRVDANMKAALDDMKTNEGLQKNIKTTGEVLKIFLGIGRIASISDNYENNQRVWEPVLYDRKI